MQGIAIGQYRVTGVLGEGGMGVVYAAEHVLLGRPAAVKVLHARLSADEEAVTRFFNEARATTAIRHPGIVEIYEVGRTEDGATFIAMELLEGETLRARLDRGPMGWSAALGLVCQILPALAAAHAKGIVHRDLKPENIFLVPDPAARDGERVKLLDFGIARFVGASPAQHMTRPGTVIGTPAYMAPEQCRGVAIDGRADLYSLGCILFELCTGRPPFVHESYSDLLIAHVQEPPPSITSLVNSVPQEIEALVQRLLAKAPDDRVQTADDLLLLIKTSKIAIKQIARRGGYPVLARRVALVDVLASPERPERRTPVADSAPILQELWEERHPRQDAAERVLAAYRAEPPPRRKTPARPITAQSDTRASTTGARESVTDTRASTTGAHRRAAAFTPRRRLMALGGAGALAIALALAIVLLAGAGSSSGAVAQAAAPAPRAEGSAPPAMETLTLPGRPAAKVTVSIQSEPRGAEIYLGDVYLGRAPQDVILDRGDHEVSFELSLSGHRARELVVRPTDTIRRTVKLAPVTP